jgi:hypothetical protein
MDSHEVFSVSPRNSFFTKLGILIDHAIPCLLYFNCGKLLDGPEKIDQVHSRGNVTTLKIYYGTP